MTFQQPDPLQRIAAAVVPAVMVSACGLIALGLDNQVSRMSMRLRELAREHRNRPESPARRATLQKQIAAFDGRHRTLTRALQLNYGALLAFVVTSFVVLASGFVPVPPLVPLIIFAAGVAMLAAMALLVMSSMSRARSALTLERKELSAEPDAV